MDELIGKRYGTALFELAQENGQLSQLKEEIILVTESLMKSEEYFEVINHPKISLDEKIKLTESILEGKVSHDLLGLIILVLQKGRQNALTAIFQYCLDAISEFEGFVKALITSSHMLGSEQKQAIEKHLSQMTNKKIDAQYKVDLSLIGGLTIRIGDKIVDNSIKGKIHQMSRELLNTKLNI